MTLATTHQGVTFAVPVVLKALGVISAADGWDQFTMPFDGIIHQVQMSIGVTGSSSGNNDAVVERTRSGSAADIWTVGSGIGRIAYDASAKFLEWDWENTGWTGYSATQIFPPSGAIVQKGDALKLNVNAAAGSGSPADLVVTLWVVPTAA